VNKKKIKVGLFVKKKKFLQPIEFFLCHTAVVLLLSSSSQKLFFSAEIDKTKHIFIIFIQSYFFAD
jgi:hypothetical protein